MNKGEYMKPKVEILDYSNLTPCYKCVGTGKLTVQGCEQDCDICNGTGKWTETEYCLVATDSNGQKIGFDVDSPGK
jgi:RecJ-like exonuclease